VVDPWIRDRNGTNSAAFVACVVPTRPDSTSARRVAVRGVNHPNSEVQTMTQTATLPDKTNISNARNLSNDKELVDRMQQVAYVGDGEFRTLIDARFWMARRRDASVVYCSVWIQGRADFYVSGYGTAGGYGYHRASAALEAALNSAGIRLSEGIHGAGDSAMREALDAVAVAMGYGDTPKVVV
jgi:hypothetical protein